MPVDRITTFCFGASYAVALVLELIQLVGARPVMRIISTGFAAAGLLAHTIFLLIQQPSLASQGGSMLFLAWILAVFYLYGSIHHRHQAWGVFVLPVVLGLVVLTVMFPPEGTGLPMLDAFRGERFWSSIHGGLLLLAAVGICVGFVASVMYLVQARRLRLKTLPGQGLQLLSLERLETMNRRAIVLAFPLLTLGVLVGFVQLLQRDTGIHDWSDPRIVGVAALWVVFALLLYLRYGAHLPGRRLAFLTIAAFILMLFTLASAHTVAEPAGQRSEVRGQRSEVRGQRSTGSGQRSVASRRWSEVGDLLRTVDRGPRTIMGGSP
jgi:ABC-type transport system involved in cytochrome c biogenesis permease subunit